MLCATFCFLLPCVGCPGCPRGAAAKPSRAGRGGGGRAAPLPAAPRAAGSRGRLSRGRLSRARLASPRPRRCHRSPPPPPPSSPHSKCARSRGSGLASPRLRRPNRPRCWAGTGPGAEGGQGRNEVPATGGLGLALEYRREKCWWKGLRSCAARGGRARLVRGLGSQTPPFVRSLPAETCVCPQLPAVGTDKAKSARAMFPFARTSLPVRRFALHPAPCAALLCTHHHAPRSPRRWRVGLTALRASSCRLTLLPPPWDGKVTPCVSRHPSGSTCQVLNEQDAFLSLPRFKMRRRRKKPP